MNLSKSADDESVLKNLLLWGFILLNIGLWIFFGYFILVNTLLKDSQLVSIAPVTFGSSQPIVFTSNSEQETISHTIKFKIGSVEKEIAPFLIDFNIDKTNLYNYGKGSDIIAVWSSAIQNIQYNPQVLPEVNVDPELLLAEFGIILTSNPEDAVKIIEDTIINCHTDKYLGNLDIAAFKREINKDVGKSSVDLELSSFINSYQIDFLYKNCNSYVSKAPLAASNINLALQTDRFKVDDLAINTNGELVISDRQNFILKLLETSKDLHTPAKMGEYKDKGDSIWLISNYVKGKELNLGATLSNIEEYIKSDFNSQTLASNLVFDDVLPVEIAGRKVYDFTQVVAQGKTRIDIIRNGVDNRSLLYAQYGVEAIDDVIVPAKSRFSYIETIKPQARGRMANGSPISGGICNATTTIYRAALEAGFQITERTPHGFYVASYEWGYPLNIVDAAYYTNPKLDLAFINDFEAPILLDTEITRPGDGWQYHTITIRTAQAVPRRDVQLTDWKKYNVFTSTRFTGEFTRIVKSGSGEIIRQDKFVSRYYR